MKKSMIFSTFISVALLSGCSAFSTHTTFAKIQQKVKPFKVRLEVAEGELTNDRTPNAGCTAFANPLRKGCFVAEKDEVLELEFRLKRKAERKKWRFTKLMICAGTNKPIPMNTCALNDTQKAEWLVNAKKQFALLPDNGTVDLTTFSDKLRVFSVLDVNGHPGDYTYNIQACPEGLPIIEANCVWMDPGGKNNGRN